MAKNHGSTPVWTKEAREILAESKLDAKDAQAIVDLMALVSGHDHKEITAQVRRDQKTQKINATKKLLQSYAKLKASVDSGVYQAIDVIDDTEIQRLMEREESVKNQQVRSLAMQAATNRVLFLQINSSLEALKTICNADQDPRFRRQYDLLYQRYILHSPIEKILATLKIERSEFYRTQRDALQTLSVILFGATTATDFFPDHIR